MDVELILLVCVALFRTLFGHLLDFSASFRLAEIKCKTSNCWHFYRIQMDWFCLGIIIKWCAENVENRCYVSHAYTIREVVLCGNSRIGPRTGVTCSRYWTEKVYKLVKGLGYKNEVCHCIGNTRINKLLQSKTGRTKMIYFSLWFYDLWSNRHKSKLLHKHKNQKQ